MKYPKHCPECGGEVAPKTAAGRTMPYRVMTALELPESLEIPTCAGCGEQYIDGEVNDSIERLLSEAYTKALAERAELALEKLIAVAPKRKLEMIFGLSQGYLSRLRSRRLSPQLVELMTLAADDPRKNLDRIQTLWGTRL